MKKLILLFILITAPLFAALVVFDANFTDGSTTTIDLSQFHSDLSSTTYTGGEVKIDDSGYSSITYWTESGDELSLSESGFDLSFNKGALIMIKDVITDSSSKFEMDFVAYLFTLGDSLSIDISKSDITGNTFEPPTISGVSVETSVRLGSSSKKCRWTEDIVDENRSVTLTNCEAEIIAQDDNGGTHQFSADFSGTSLSYITTDSYDSIYIETILYNSSNDNVGNIRLYRNGKINIPNI